MRYTVAYQTIDDYPTMYVSLEAINRENALVDFERIFNACFGGTLTYKLIEVICHPYYFVGSVPEGTVIETYHYNHPSGNFYRIGKGRDFAGNQRDAFGRFTQRKVRLYRDNTCRTFTSEEVRELGGFPVYEGDITYDDIGGI